MKKLIYFFTGCIGILFSSCSKSYNCSCTYSYDGNTYQIGPSSLSVEARKELEAESKCFDELERYFINDGYTSEEFNYYASTYKMKCTSTRK